MVLPVLVTLMIGLIDGLVVEGVAALVLFGPMKAFVGSLIELAGAGVGATSPCADGS